MGEEKHLRQLELKSEEYVTGLKQEEPSHEVNVAPKNKDAPEDRVIIILLGGLAVESLEH